MADDQLLDYLPIQDPDPVLSRTDFLLAMTQASIPSASANSFISCPSNSIMPSSTSSNPTMLDRRDALPENSVSDSISRTAVQPREGTLAAPLESRTTEPKQSAVGTNSMAHETIESRRAAIAVMQPPEAHPSLSTAAGTQYGASDLYWARLDALLNEAHAKLLTLRPSPLEPVEHMGARGAMATLLQGKAPNDVHAALAAVTDDAMRLQYQQLLGTEAAGQYVDYGVVEAHAEWVLAMLRAVGTSEIMKSVDAIWVRVRVFEAEVACLPVHIVDDLLTARKAMHKMRARIDTCVRILLAMEGRGRKVQQATLDKLKASLEKAEVQAQADARKNAERERVRQERDSKANASDQTNASATAASVTPTSTRKAALDEKRRKERAQQSAQASFMMRFIRAKTTDSRGTPCKIDPVTNDNDVTAAAENNEDASRRREGLFSADLADDPDVMDVSWWVRSHMRTPGYTSLDEALHGGGPAISDKPGLQAHLESVARRREAAQKSVRRAMLEFRRSRREHVGDRNPHLVMRRSACRCRSDGYPVKLLQFAEDHRPAYYGTRRGQSRTVRGRKPFAKDIAVDYDYDSEEDWDEDEDGEDLSDMEADMERATEDAELRKLYGSDEEDDDDFLDDEEVEEDDEEEEEENGNGEESKGVDIMESTQGADIDEVTGATTGNSTGAKDTAIDLGSRAGSEGATNVEDDNRKRAAQDELKRAGKRRKGGGRQNVVIEGPSPPIEGGVSLLERFPVSSVEGAGDVPMFNPYAFDVAHATAEHLKPRAGPSRNPRVAMDDAARTELATVVSKGSKDGFTRDRIVAEFCQSRKASGLDTPSKSEIVRAIGDMATFEKREGDTRASWYLNSDALSPQTSGP